MGLRPVLRIGILTVSDRSARGERPDLSGPAIEKEVVAQGWKIGKQDSRSNNIGKRIKDFLVEGILHRRILQDFYPGLIHLFLFIGFIVPFVVIVIVQFVFTLPSPISKWLSLFLDLVALFGLAALVLAFYRRYISRPSRLDNRLDDLICLILLFFIMSIA